ncbi:MAG: cation diffusion facilitator family transporter, partial [Eubacteriales bacterium]|nr:cation diffusion facilitator family transporter [Eubacteriales bacterium]
MYRFLVKKFVKNHEKVKDSYVRNAYSKFAATIGIATNLLLCTFKIVIGALFGSIAILADGVNNLTDASSSVILLIGTKLSAKPADKEHPFGHARIEYLTGLMISFIILLLGFQLLLASVKKALHPTPIEFNWLTVLVLLAAIGIKIWQARFYWYIGRTINSSTIKATSADSRNDVIATSSVLVSILVGEFFKIQIDGWIGALVALFIIYSGIQLIRETASPLLGTPNDPDLVKEIESRILAYPGVKGLHDLVVHSYGPARIFATVHIEVAYRDD